MLPHDRSVYGDDMTKYSLNTQPLCEIAGDYGKAPEVHMEHNYLFQKKKNIFVLKI